MACWRCASVKVASAGAPACSWSITPTALPTCPAVSARGSSNGQVSAHLYTQTKPPCDTSHLHGTIFFALKGALTYIYTHDSNTHWLCALLHRQTGSRCTAGDARRAWGRTRADLYG